MVCGGYKCFICGGIYSLSRRSKNPQSILKVDSGELTEYTKTPIFNHACLKCYNLKIKEVKK